MTVAAHSEASEVDALEKNASWTVGSIGYLLSTTWWNTWVQYSNYVGAAAAASLLQLPGGSGPRPGPISNTDLLAPGYSASKPQLPCASSAEPRLVSDPEALPLRPNLVEQRDFVVVSAATWQHLYSTYGGGPAVARRVIADAAPGSSGRKAGTDRWARLALYPLRLEVLYKATDGKDRSTVLSMDPEASLAVLKARACAALGVAESEVALWDYTGGKPVRSLEAAPPGGSVTGTAPMAVEDGTPAAPATADGAADRAGSGVGCSGASMEIDNALGPGGQDGVASQSQVGAPTKTAAKHGVMGQSLREVPLLDMQLLGLRKMGANITSFDADDKDGEDACGSDNENDTRPAVGRKEGGKKAAGSAAGRVSVVEEAATATAQRASAAGSSRSDGGSGAAVPAPPATARTSGGNTGLTYGSNRSAGQRPPWGSLEDNVIQRDGQPPGLAGLSNLGNTCFMNSSLQCLAHAVPLMTAFLGGAYLQDLNRTNPLGMKGELAEAFGALMEQLWRGGLSAVTPRSFKAKIGRFAPQFSGYAQHDSQEFLAFLLDGLHEDTNRIKNKPYIEEKDQPGRPDEVVAAEAWANYRARNDSLVVDHFQGLFKSTVDCPQCSFNSVKFDPFMYLSLPLPESRRRVVEVILVRTDGSELPCRMALELSSGATLVDLLRATAQTGTLPAEVAASPECHLLVARPMRGPSGNYDELTLLTDARMRVADALDAGSVSSYSLRSSANNTDSGLVVYYFPDAARGPRAEGLSPVIVHFKRPDSRKSTSWNRGVWCGAPLVLYMPVDQPPYAPEQVIKVSSGPGNRSELEISGDCPLAAALVEVLQPIQRPQLAAAAPPILDGTLPTKAEVQVGPSAAEADSVGLTVPAPRPQGSNGVDLSVSAAGPDGKAGQPVVAPAAPAPMDEDERVVGRGGVADAADAARRADEELRPSTPTWNGDHNGAGACASACVKTPFRRCSSNGVGQATIVGEQMEGVEQLAAPAPATLPVTSSSGLAGGAAAVGYGDASMPGTPQPAASAALEDDVGAAGPAQLPAVIIAGPPESEYAARLGPTDIQPFDMWAAQGSWGPDNTAVDAGATAAGPSGTATATTDAAGPLTGAPFSLKLCTSKGESTLWGGMYDKDIKVEHHREFLLMFRDAYVVSTSAANTVTASGADVRTAGSGVAGAVGTAGPYAAELLDSPTEHPSLGEHRRRAAAGPQPVSLDACMTTFLQPERLAETDAWYCPRCKSHVCADKKLDLWSLPEVLVVHLKRFSYTRYSRNKLDTRVDFPLHGLDLGPYVMRPQGVGPVYDLFAVSNHYGSLGGGHYTAYVKLPSPPPSGSQFPQEGAQGAATAEVAPADKWYCFDDSHVSPVAPEAVRSPAAYVLFYRRRAEAAADPPDVGDLLERLGQQHVDLQHQLASGTGIVVTDGSAAHGAVVGPGGSPDLGSDRRPENDQDQGSRGAFGASRRGGAACVAGEVSIAAAAAAAQAARRDGGAAPAACDDEDIEMEGRNTPAFDLECGHPTVAGTYRHRRIEGSGGGGRGDCSSGSYDDGAAVAGPVSPAPMSVGNTYGGASGDVDADVTAMGRSTDLFDEPLQYGRYGGAYDPRDFGAFVSEDTRPGGGFLGHCERGLLQPPGSPAEPELDMNNADLSGLYQEVEDMDVVRDRHSGSDMASAGGNDLDPDVDDDDEVGLDEGKAETEV